MKPTSPLSLLFFLQSASTAPVPLTTNCHSTSCVISLLGSPHQPPPTHFTEPHFPEHQQDFSSPAPITKIFSTSSSQDTSETLTSTQPLSSSFLLSLTNPATNPTIQKAPLHTSPSTTPQNLPSKPSSALPELRAADLRKYWETLRPSPSSPKNAQMHSCDMGGEILGSERFYYMRRTRLGTRRDYADLMVVGIVVLFLAVVVALEAVERFGDLGGIICSRRQRRGEIYLGDDDNLFVVKRPFEASPMPGFRNPSTDGYRDEKAAFTYDSNANERI